MLPLVIGQPGRNEETVEIAFHTLNSFVLWSIYKYRPEYNFAYHIFINVAEPFIVWPNLMIAPLIVFLLHFVLYYSDTTHRVNFGRKATQEATRFRDAWLECSERNPDTVTELAKLCKGIYVRLDKQRKEAVQMSWWTPPVWGRAQAFLEQRVGRWSLLCKCKVRQESTDLDLLMADAGVINEKFLDLVSEIGFNGFSRNHSSGLDFVVGPVKQPMRTLQKLVRNYRRDVGCLTDLVRCAVIAYVLMQALLRLYSGSIQALLRLY